MSKELKRKIVAVLVAVALLCAFGACKSAENAGGGSGEVASATAEGAATSGQGQEKYELPIVADDDVDTADGTAGKASGSNSDGAGAQAASGSASSSNGSVAGAGGNNATGSGNGATKAANKETTKATSRVYIDSEGNAFYLDENELPIVSE